MNKRKIVKIAFAILSISIVIILLFENRTNFIRNLWDEYVLDNKNHYLSCEKLPSVKEINKVIEDNRDLLEKIIIEVGQNYKDEVIPVWREDSVTDGESINFSISWGELTPQCQGKGRGDILFVYNSHRDREIIEKYIQNETFLGIPYRFRNV